MKKKPNKPNPLRKIRRICNPKDTRSKGYFLITLYDKIGNDFFHFPIKIDDDRDYALFNCPLNIVVNQPVFEINLDPENPTIIAHSAWDFRQLVAEAKYNRLMQKNKKTMESVLVDK